ncbi:MAG: zinc ribbon domain-containing protein [Phycisphaerae bacterium]|nr:zinc ribbon domain-containing protein [Gemmatimonadaceae bacterium]
MTPSANSTPGGTIAPGGYCAACGAALSAGARFCHRCGTPVGQGAPMITPGATPGLSSSSKIIPGLAFVGVLALVAYFAGQNFGKAKGSAVDGSSNSIANPSIDGPAMGPPPGQRAPDISNMTASERASRLYERIMTYAENNKMDSAMMFIPMGIPAHQAIETPSNDERYHLARLGEVAKDTALARAQADTILATEPSSLLGLMAGIRAAELNGNAAKQKQLNQKFLSVLDAELAKNPTDYQMHRFEIDLTTTEARKKN